MNPMNGMNGMILVTIVVFNMITNFDKKMIVDFMERNYPVSRIKINQSIHSSLRFATLSLCRGRGSCRGGLRLALRGWLRRGGGR